jgi:ABC-2 type transport system permease protein
MREIIALAVKDSKLLVRDKTGFFFVIFFPLLMAVFFGSIFGGSGGGQSSSIPILVVDEDMSEESRAFIGRLDDGGELEVLPATREEAVDQVRRGKVSAYIALKPGFGEASKRMFWGEPPTVELGADPSRRATAAMLHGILMKYGAERFQKLFSDPTTQRNTIDDARESLRSSTGVPPAARANLEEFFTDLDRFLGDDSQMTQTDTAGTGGGPRGGLQPLVVEKADITVARRGPTSAYAISFPQGAIWGILAAAAAFGISIVVERTHGTLVRLQTAPISRTQILAGKALACFATTVVISVVLFSLARVVFGLRPGSVPLLALAIVSASIAFVGIMMLLSVLGKTEQSAGGIGWGILLVMSMIGGGMIPLFALPSWMLTVSHFSPVKWAILSMEGAVWRQFTLGEMMLPCGILWAVGVVCFLIGVRAFAWTTQS